MPSGRVHAEIIRILLVLTFTSTAAPTLAFHDGGSADCGGCHIAHDTQDGLPQPPGGLFSEGLLRAETPSDLCLSCHADTAGSVFGRDPLMPYPERGSGNFIFLLEDNLNDAPGGLGVISGDAAGHNVDAPGHGLQTDSRRPISPGGSFPAAQMECTSCHDPHGNNNFRLLYGAGPVQGGIFIFTRPAPRAAGIPLDSHESSTNHSAYRSGMSDWCANCHGPSYHQDGLVSGFEHPSNDSLGSSISARYSAYNGDADPDGGTAATAYLPEVPFEDISVDVSSSAGPSASSRVMCLSCHRAHASSSPAAGRWDFKVEALSSDGVPSGSYPLPSPFAEPVQGSLCRKCHTGGSAPIRSP